MWQRWLRQQWDFPNVWPPLVEMTVGIVSNNQQTIYLLWIRLYLLKRQTPLLGKVWQKQLQTISSTTFSGIDWLYIYKGFVKNPPLLARERRSEERSGNIYEKYNCTGAGRPGGGGEYDVQVRLAPHFSFRMIILIFCHISKETSCTIFVIFVKISLW